MLPYDEAMILAGDIGGTKTQLALVDAAQVVKEQRFASAEYESLDAIVAEFLAEAGTRPAAACFGIAGRVAGRQARATNLPWLVDADQIGRIFRIPDVTLINDLQAVATAVPHLAPDQVYVLNVGEPEMHGVIGVVAPGTGLGEAFMTWTGDGYRAWPSEGGHASFAPVTPEQLGLLQYLEPRFGHVSYERVCSGSAIPDLYDYLVATGRYEESESLREAIQGAQDPTPMIVEAGMQRVAPIAVAALDLFVHILGGVVGNMALRLLATGGIYLGGGLPARILDRLKQRDFLDAIRFKGRYSDWIASVPVSVILDPNAALHGAAWHALRVGHRGGAAE